MYIIGIFPYLWLFAFAIISPKKYFTGKLFHRFFCFLSLLLLLVLSVNLAHDFLLEECLNIIEENLLVPQYSGVADHAQIRSTTPATKVIEEQVQLDSTTPIEDEQCEEQVEGLSNQTKKEDKYDILKVGKKYILESVQASGESTRVD
ncbi:uncharacterized protein LOC107763785 [Nicotiana tabacum]|uniref:Uncharacterized protein LOC107763785 n=2 Tax=Nicotiana TaxID=4085 RepID=A0A1S3XCY7_TOBAC|nr:PREDICTED: uncharacterized protein LOC104226158 [Nicotiana sylvestris]XP_016437767.1 PREDICTED: uncharacterized protein LOC107763785 [Nicotiana tabacum]